MNIYIETCKRHLKDIVAGRISYELHLETLIKSIKYRIQEADEIIVCGLSPLGRKCTEYISTYTQAPILTYDLRDIDSSDLKYLRGGAGYDTTYIQTYIICSREEALTYLNEIPRCNSRIISYNELMLLDEKFGIQGSLLHNKEFVNDVMKNVFSHSEDYLKMIDDLSDEFSQELLSRWILYRLYEDIAIMRNIEGRGKPYFDPEIIEIKEQEIFVDAGGYDGDTLSDFLELSNNRFSKYYFFEPENTVYLSAKEKFGFDERIEFYKKGLAEKNAIKYFDIETPDVPEMMQKDTGNIAIEVTSIDNLKITPSFIKMDIEGAECDALDGAEQTIRTFMPTLAICVYHKPNDILDVFHRMKNYGYSNYYLRAEKNTLDYDIVLYAK